MKYNIKTCPDNQHSSCLILGIFEDYKLSAAGKRIDKLANGSIRPLLKKYNITGKINQYLMLNELDNIPSERILLIGCGKKQDLDIKVFRNIISKAMQLANDHGSKDVLCCLTELEIEHENQVIKHAIEAIETAFYSFEDFKSKKTATKQTLSKITFSVANKSELKNAQQGLQQGQAVARSVILSRDLGNTPANECTPSYLVEKSRNLAKTSNNLTVKVLEEKDMKKLGMGAFLAVTAGSSTPGKLIIMEYKPNKKKQAPIVMVGKGITFDTGGNSLKPANSMIGMKYDMCGAATVLGIMQFALDMKLSQPIIGVMACAENTPGGEACRPDDIVKTLSGLTVEILNTDAEGRLVLCDALSYVERYKPKVVIDIATLTGACIVALGNHATALYSNDNELAKQLYTAGKTSNDRCWQMPLWDCYNKQLESPFADLANIGSNAGSITAACFLGNFTKKYKWAHLDIAGTACQFTGPKRHSTGRPIGLLAQYLINMENN